MGNATIQLKMKLCSIFTIMLSILNVDLLNYYYLFALPFSSETERESEASETTTSPHGELWCRNYDQWERIGKNSWNFCTSEAAHFKYCPQHALNATTATQKQRKPLQQWIMDSRTRTKTLCALSMLVIVVFLWCAQTTTWCLYLLCGFKIEGVSIKVNHVKFQINPCQQIVPISLYSYCNAVL